MSDSPKPLRRASFTFHVCSILGMSREDAEAYPVPLTRLVKRLDEALDLFDTDSQFQHLTLNGEVAPLEDYLTIRPENFERVEQAVREHQLLIGPFYVSQHEDTFTPETLIRNLMIGMQTARAFGTPMQVAYLGWDIRKLSGFMPQIFRSFGISVVIARHRENLPTENIWKGNDGSEIHLVFAAFSDNDQPVIEEIRTKFGAVNESGQLLILKRWELECASQSHIQNLQSIFSAVGKSGDEGFHSNLLALARLVERIKPLPIFQVNEKQNARISDNEHYLGKTEQNLRYRLELLAAWAACFEEQTTELQLRRPQRLIQNLWKHFLKRLINPIREVPEFLFELWEQEHSELISICGNYALRTLYDIAAQINTNLLPVHTKYALVFFNPDPFEVKVKVWPADDVTDVIFYDQSGNVSQESFEIVLPAFGYTCYSSTSYQISTSNKDTKLGVFPFSTSIHDGVLPLSGALLTISDPNFYISAIKPPEDSDRTGLIVRGYNTASEPLRITLTPFRAFATVEIVTMDEAPTGGKLALEPEGAVTFRALPQHILTFWFHD